MGGGHGHGPSIIVPDWRVMKVKGIEPLENIQQALAAKGLKDPWLRNYVFRYPPELSQNAMSRIFSNVTVGMRAGAVFFLAALGIKATYQFIVPPKDHHHGEHH